MVVTNDSTAFICNFDTWPPLFVRLLFDVDDDDLWSGYNRDHDDDTFVWGDNLWSQNL